MKLSKYIFYLLFLCNLFSTVNTAQAENAYVKIAIVDVQYVVENSIAMQKIRQKIESISKTLVQNVSAKEIQIKKIEEDLLQKKNNLNAQEFERQVNIFNNQVTEAQQKIHVQRAQLEQARNHAVEEVHGAIISIIHELAKKYNLTLILPSAQILYARPELNITEEIITKLNNKVKAVEFQFKLGSLKELN